MYILTDGKNYVMENPMKQGEYISTTSPIHAKNFTYKQARSLLQNKKKPLGWVRSFRMVDNDTGETATEIPKYSNEGVFTEKDSYEFDESILDNVKNEVNSIMGLAAWNVEELNTYSSMLNQGLQYFDSAISDVKHARMGKRPPAHIRTIVDGIANELEEKRRDVKQNIKYISILIKAINERWTITKIKIELEKSKYVPYKGRTKYFDIVEKLLKGY